MSDNYATREDFFAETKRRYKPVRLWNGKRTRIRSLSESEYSEIDSRNIDFKRGGLSATGVRGSNVQLVMACVCDADGNPLFGGEEDAKKLAQLDSALIEPLVHEIRDHCGLKKDAVEAEKNSEPTGGGSSPSSSAGPSPTT